MNILIIGGGGREHAFAWKVAQSPHADTVFVAPGNGGTQLEPGIENVSIQADNVSALIAFARKNAIGLTLVGPEAPLVTGIVDAFAAVGLRCFGPTQQAAALEGSKSFTKDFLTRHHIPTGAYCTFTERAAAVRYIKEQGTPIVVKADGLAAGKGVVLAQTEDEALSAVDLMLSGEAFGKAGRQVVIEELLMGEEASFIVMVDGEHTLALASSQDHKARDNGDRGPNTGGMGAYSPAPVVTGEIYQRIMDQVISPTVAGMAAEGRRYVGFLYAGLMIGPNGTPRVLEYNCRCGDPETQPILMRMQSDLVELCEAAVDGRLHEINVAWDPRPSLGVVMAARGYPGAYRKGDVITGLDKVNTPIVKVFHAGTQTVNNQVVTAGGRVLCVTALGHTVQEAQANAYAAVANIHWQDPYFRTDIGYRAVTRESSG
jgi:phosphoribosylamine--glycine ligase